MTTRGPLVVVTLLAMLGGAAAEPAPLIGLAAADDARQAIPIGPAGQVYLPDGKGAWTRAPQYATATTLATVERGTSGVYASGGGAVYHLAPNGWSAVRITQKGRAIGGTGRRALAAVGRDVYDLDRAVNASGEPMKVASAPAAVTAIGGAAVETEQSLARLDGSKLVPLHGGARPLDGRWGISGAGAVDLRTGKSIPIHTTIETAGVAADGAFVAVTRNGELVTVTADRPSGVAIPIEHPGRAVGVVVDRAGRVAIAYADGRLALRDHDTWTIATLDPRLPPPRPGSPPATSP